VDNGFLVLSKIGRIGVQWSRPFEGTPKTVTISSEADGWYVAISCADVPAHPLPPTGQETGIDLGVESFATLADGTMIHNPRCSRRAERQLAKCQRRVSRRQKGSPDAAKPSASWRKPIRRYAGNGPTSTTRRRFRWCERTTRWITKMCRSALWCGTTPSPRASPMPGGGRSSPSWASRRQAPGGQWVRWILRSRARRALAAASWSTKAYPSAGIPAPRVARACIGTTPPPGPFTGAGSALGDSRGSLRGGTENPPGCSPCGVSVRGGHPALAAATARTDGSGVRCGCWSPRPRAARRLAPAPASQPCGIGSCSARPPMLYEYVYSTPAIEGVFQCSIPLLVGRVPGRRSVGLVKEPAT
jgi:hypothetical protein